MFNKSIAFGLVAASLMIVPTAAFAGGRQSQDNSQVTIQEGAAVDGSTNAQTSRSVNVQNHTQTRPSRSGYGRSNNRYGRSGYCAGTSQSARSRQETIQNGAAVGGSVNAQESRTTNVQSGRVSGC